MTLLSAAHPTVWISSILGLIIAPTAAFQQYKLTQVEALQQTNVVFERETQKLSQENAKLQQTVQQMEESVLKYVFFYVYISFCCLTYAYMRMNHSHSLYMLFLTSLFS
jgi:hypothetical protein